jgi:hypothetical protein
MNNIIEAIAERDVWQRRYEQLRQAIDGGSESMTHEDAVREVRHLREEHEDLFRQTCDLRSENRELGRRLLTVAASTPTVEGGKG